MAVWTSQEYELEKQLKENARSSGRRRPGRALSVCCAVCCPVLGGGHLMSKRAKSELSRPLVRWSLALAVFSVLGALRTGAYLAYMLMTPGLEQSICDLSFYSGPLSKFWAYAFVLSKAPELGDTLLITVRKQKLISLHWHHRITVLLYSWSSTKTGLRGWSVHDSGWSVHGCALWPHAVVCSY